MVWFLRILFAGVIASMLVVTTWAGLECPLFAVPRAVATHPWFIATLVDAYWGFLTFFVWVAWKEQSWSARWLWFVAIMLLGNIAMSVYVLRELFAVETNAALRDVVAQRNPGNIVFPGALVVLAILTYVVAWRTSFP